MSRFYFCYSSALDTEALEVWKGQHGYPDFHLQTGEVAMLPGYRLVFNFASRFWGGRVAGLQIMQKPSDRVYGVLFRIDEELWPAVEHKEGVMTGVSIPVKVQVESLVGLVEATAFTTNPTRESLDGPLSPTFLETLQKAYRHWKLPPAALQALSDAT